MKRGGVSMAFTRFLTANNSYIPSYDENIPTSYLTYQDANNLYGYAMS